MADTSADRTIEEERELLRSLCAKGGVVFFGGAGVSTESGIPDFRSPDGLYNQQYDYPPEQIISRSFFDAHPEEFYRFYRDRVIFTDARPNPAHRTLARLEREGLLNAVVTQNIDGLHQAAGSRTVYELHGSIHRNHCMRCHAAYPLDFIVQTGKDDPRALPLCPACGGLVKPDVVLYEEPLDDRVITGAVRAISQATTLIIAGTSLVVYPAAGFIDYFKGRHLVVINRTPTSRDAGADLLIRHNVGEVFDW
jgi:NAD-dependent deacetylase